MTVLQHSASRFSDSEYWGANHRRPPAINSATIRTGSSSFSMAWAARPGATTGSRVWRRLRGGGRYQPAAITHDQADERMADFHVEPK
jgi:hypothetical protein